MVQRETLLPSDLPANICSLPVHETHIRVGTSLAEAERALISATLQAFPTIKASAIALGLGLRTLHTKIGLYGLRLGSRRRKR